MTIPLIVLLVALGLLVSLGVALVVLGAWLAVKRDTEAAFLTIVAGAIVAGIATGCLYEIASAPTCRLAPSNLVENPK